MLNSIEFIEHGQEYVLTMSVFKKNDSIEFSDQLKWGQHLLILLNSNLNQHITRSK